MLSVSLCPNAWVSIAKLGGNKVWSMEKEGALFLDVLALYGKKNTSLRRDIEEWGVSAGLAEKKTMWRSWCDDESGLPEDRRFMLCSSEESACEEAYVESSGDLFDDGKPIIEKTEILELSEKGASRASLKRFANKDGFDLVAGFWAEDILRGAGLDVQGVYWRETFAPEMLSAHRGGVFPSLVEQWAAKEERWSDVVDLEDAKEACGLKPKGVRRKR